jgi:hypothetical protein
MKTILFLIFFIFTNTFLHAQPVYLNCITDDDNKDYNFTLKSDEYTGKITHTGIKKTYNAVGFYSPEELSYNIIDISSFFDIRISCNINRNDLSFICLHKLEIVNKTLLNMLNNEGEVSDKKVNGKCELVEMKDKAF